MILRESRLQSVLLSGVLAIVCLLTIGSGVSLAGGKVGIYGLNMRPNGADAEKYSDPGWGIGLHAVLPVTRVHSLLAATLGFEFTNLLSEKINFRDKTTGLRIEQQTSQNYLRFYFGARVGGHGNAFVRPFAGANIAVVHYRIDTDVVIPDDSHEDNEIRQDLRSSSETAFGYDFSFGCDLNFSNTIVVEAGARYLKSFSVPQQLGEGSVDISPEYYQIYIGVGMAFEWIKSMTK